MNCYLNLFHNVLSDLYEVQEFVIADEFFEFDDWCELYNSGSSSIELIDFYFLLSLMNYCSNVFNSNTFPFGSSIKNVFCSNSVPSNLV